MLRKFALVVLASAFAVGVAGCGEKKVEETTKTTTETKTETKK